MEPHLQHSTIATDEQFSYVAGIYNASYGNNTSDRKFKKKFN